MNELQVFSNPDFGSVRSLTIDGDPWFVGKDIAVALGYEKPTDAVRKHIDDEDRGISKMETPSGMQDTTIINESGMYSLILSSKLPSAKRFKRWITSEVLPQIRRTGSYGTGNQRELTPDDYLRAAQIISTCKNERLPYVLSLIQKSGIQVPQPKVLITGIVERDTAGETADYIRRAMERGMSIRGIGRITGEHPQQISRIHLGQSSPKMAKATSIINAIRDALPDIDDE